MAAEKLVLLPQDTTSLNYSGLKKTEGLGKINGEGSLGLHLHSTLALSGTGVPLGVVDAHVAFRLNPGEIHLMRNAGGIISDDVIRSLAISQHALGTREVMIVHHTDCGLAMLNEDEFREELAKFAGYRPTWSVQAFKDPHDSVRESMRRVKDSPFLHHTGDVRGFIFDVETGLMEEVPTDDETDRGRESGAG